MEVNANPLLKTEGSTWTCTGSITSSLVGASLEDLRRVIPRVAHSQISTLITGPTGTGKDLVAKTLHLSSPRVSRPFISFNVASVPESMMQRQLFGCTRGAYTGALEGAPGLFEAADGGTLFLNEIAEMPASAQAMLLSALDEGWVMPIGGTRPKRVNVWVISATNRNVSSDDSKSGLRSDLYFRLARIRLSLPTLRSRSGDIPELADHLIARHASELNVKPVSFAASAMRILMRHGWAGNVRELEDLILSLLVTQSGRILEAGDVAPLLAIGTRRPVRMSRQQLRQALKRAGGVKSRAALLLGVSRGHFYRLWEQYVDNAVRT